MIPTNKYGNKHAIFMFMGVQNDFVRATIPQKYSQVLFII